MRSLKPPHFIIINLRISYQSKRKSDLSYHKLALSIKQPHIPNQNQKTKSKKAKPKNKQGNLNMLARKCHRLSIIYVIFVFHLLFILLSYFIFISKIYILLIYLFSFTFI